MREGWRKQITLRIIGFNPEQGSKRRSGRYRVAVEPTDQVLNVLHAVMPMRGFWVIKDLVGDTEASFAQ